MKIWSVTKRVALFLMVSALAVTFVACQAAAPTPKDPEPGPTGPAGEDAPKLPYLTEGFAPVELAASGEMATKPVSLAGHFVDPQGSSLPIALCPRRLVS